MATIEERLGALESAVGEITAIIDPEIAARRANAASTAAATTRRTTHAAAAVARSNFWRDFIRDRCMVGPFHLATVSGLDSAMDDYSRALGQQRRSDTRLTAVGEFADDIRREFVSGLNLSFAAVHSAGVSGDAEAGVAGVAVRPAFRALIDVESPGESLQDSRVFAMRRILDHVAKAPRMDEPQLANLAAFLETLYFEKQAGDTLGTYFRRYQEFAAHMRPGEPREALYGDVMRFGGALITLPGFTLIDGGIVRSRFSIPADYTQRLLAAKGR